MASSEEILSLVSENLNPDQFREQHWEGSFEEYLKLVTANPRIARNAFQRVYDMITHFGCDRYTMMRQELTRYKFFSDPIGDGVDAIFGLDRALMNLVDFFKSASHQYGTERRILLLHGPVGRPRAPSPDCLRRVWSTTRGLTKEPFTRSRGRFRTRTARPCRTRARCTRTR